eukprot:3386288-Pleurochrysis_carterae.AAC.1
MAIYVNTHVKKRQHTCCCVLQCRRGCMSMHAAWHEQSKPFALTQLSTACTCRRRIQTLIVSHTSLAEPALAGALVLAAVICKDHVQ